MPLLMLSISLLRRMSVCLCWCSLSAFYDACQYASANGSLWSIWRHVSLVPHRTYPPHMNTLLKINKSVILYFTELPIVELYEILGYRKSIGNSCTSVVSNTRAWEQQECAHRKKVKLMKISRWPAIVQTHYCYFDRLIDTAHSI